jgi:hypothetical protein
MAALYSALPRELQDCIYEYVLTDPVGLSCRTGNDGVSRICASSSPRFTAKWSCKHKETPSLELRLQGFLRYVFATSFPKAGGELQPDSVRQLSLPQRNLWP